MESGTEMIRREATRHGLPISGEQADGIAHFLATLARWNRALRLTADPAPARLVGEHLPDSLVVARLLREAGSVPETILDIGSGAGFPALPLCLLLPESRFTLVEPRKRRCSFLRTCLHELKLGDRCDIRDERLEALDLPPAGLAISKATFPPDRWLEVAAPLVDRSGSVALLTTGEELAPKKSGGLSRYASHCYATGSGVPRFIGLYRPGE